ncbi:MAG: hypothetical protein CMB48_01905, partial [Euryarchaeota archaeon]|nr:hypothetical protein [Euryarchaeota archaeon]
EIRSYGTRTKFVIAIIISLIILNTNPTIEITSLRTLIVSFISLILLTLIIMIPLSFVNGLGDKTVWFLGIDRLKGDLNSWEDEKLSQSIRELESEYLQYSKELK